MSCSCHKNAPCSYCADLYECSKCDRLLHPSDSQPDEHDRCARCQKSEEAPVGLSDSAGRDRLVTYIAELERQLESAQTEVREHTAEWEAICNETHRAGRLAEEVADLQRERDAQAAICAEMREVLREIETIPKSLGIHRRPNPSDPGTSELHTINAMANWAEKALSLTTTQAEARVRRMREALEWMSKKRHLTFYIEEHEHVADFFSKLDEALKESE